MTTKEKIKKAKELLENGEMFMCGECPLYVNDGKKYSYDCEYGALREIKTCADTLRKYIELNEEAYDQQTKADNGKPNKTSLNLDTSHVSIGKSVFAEYHSPFEQVLNEMLDTYKAKNADYGNSFEKLLESIEDNGYPAELALFIRASDKINRLITLAKQEQKVKGESIRDTVLDLANYSAMFVAWLDKKKGAE